MSNKPLIVIIAGPNGAGKTTFAKRFLTAMMEIPIFVNADLIAQGLSPYAPETVPIEAGRIMLERIDELVSAGVSFAFETTLASRTYLQKIERWRQAGYYVSLNFIQLEKVEFSISRVAHRVAQGGHHVPEEDIRRRFERGFRYLADYQAVVDEWFIYNGSTDPVELIDQGERK